MADKHHDEANDKHRERDNHGGIAEDGQSVGVASQLNWVVNREQLPEFVVLTQVRAGEKEAN